MTNTEAKRIVTDVMPRYQGRLTHEQVAEGVRLAQENAVRLLNAARLLLHSGYASIAMSLSILAVEEQGKIKILQKIGDATDADEINDLWFQYHNHISKTTAFTEGFAKRKGIVGEHELSEFCENNSDMLPLIDLMKQVGFYTDCSRNCHWQDPKKIGNIIASAIFSAAEEAIVGKISPDMIVFQKVMSEMEHKK